MRLININYADAEGLSAAYRENIPFSHIVLDDFIEPVFLARVLSEFPDLSTLDDVSSFNTSNEIKLASKGFKDLSPAAFELISYLNSDLFLTYLQNLTGISEPLISDPYLIGGGYHEIKNGGVLKVHADFNKHGALDLDRRVNLLLYLNKDWQKDWGGNLELYDHQNLDQPVVSVRPEFNRCVIFNTTSYTYHGHPDPIKCPTERSRKSIALYYYSQGRPDSEISENHTTRFVATKGESLSPNRAVDLSFKRIVKSLLPPILTNLIKRFF